MVVEPSSRESLYLARCRATSADRPNKAEKLVGHLTSQSNSGRVLYVFSKSVSFPRFERSITLSLDVVPVLLRTERSFADKSPSGDKNSSSWQRLIEIGMR